MEIKKEFLGQIYSSPSTGTIKLENEPWIIDALASAGQFQFLNEHAIKATALVPLASRSDEELRELAKGYKGFKKSMSREKLLELIANAPLNP